MKTNSEVYPEAWEFFEEHARNMEGTDEEHLGKYRIPHPTRLGDFIHAEDPAILFRQMVRPFYTEHKDSPSVHGKIQFIVNNLNH